MVHIAGLFIGAYVFTGVATSVVALPEYTLHSKRLPLRQRCANSVCMRGASGNDQAKISLIAINATRALQRFVPTRAVRDPYTGRQQPFKAEGVFILVPKRGVF
ncbi:MAG: hypothetical protein ACN6O2_09630 [Stenotrophomonas sp.]